MEKPEDQVIEGGMEELKQNASIKIEAIKLELASLTEKRKELLDLLMEDSFSSDDELEPEPKRRRLFDC